jgi:hypothetical protein
MNRRLIVTLLTVPALLGGGATPAAAAPSPTVVVHNEQETVVFPDDICGPRASTTVFTRKIVQSRFTERADGSFQYREVAVVTYESDYVDPAVEDVSGRLTEVNHFSLTPGGVFVGTVAFHDFFGDVKIHSSVHITEVKGQIVVERSVDRVTGCP